MVVLWCLIEKMSLNFVLKKGYFLTKFHVYIKHGHLWKGMTSVLSGNIMLDW